MNTTPSLRCIIVDDERLARKELAALLAEAGGCELLGEATSVKECSALLLDTDPDVIFLDVEMPGANGFELLNQLKDPPLIVFVTAYDQFAVRAFSVRAADYLLKPVRIDRMRQCLSALRERIDNSSTESDRLFLPNRNGGHFISLTDIHLVRAYDHYLRIYHPGGNDMLRETLLSFETSLPKDQFFRANRSEIIRLSSVVSVEKRSRGRYALLLPGEEQVVVSEARARVLRKSGLL